MFFVKFTLPRKCQHAEHRDHWVAVPGLGMTEKRAREEELAELNCWLRFPGLSLQPARMPWLLLQSPFRKRKPSSQWVVSQHVPAPGLTVCWRSGWGSLCINWHVADGPSCVPPCQDLCVAEQCVAGMGDGAEVNTDSWASRPSGSQLIHTRWKTVTMLLLMSVPF